LGALLAAMAFSSDRAVLAPCCGFRAIRLRQVADDHAIGNVAASVGLLALVPERHLDGKPDCVAIQACGIRGPATAIRCALAGSAPSQETDRTFMYKLCAPHPPARRPAGRPGRAGSACPG
jgi:hypothetical protein